MDPALLLPGTIGGPADPLVRSPLLHDWRGRDAALVARTGQVLSAVRAGWASARDINGAFALAVHSQPAWNALDLDGDGVREELGILLELQRANLLANPFAPATQTVSLAAGTYTLSVWGSGSCALSGGPVGTATEGKVVIFTLDATTSVTFTVAGTLTAFQCEAGGFGTSPATGTRYLSYLSSPWLARPQAALHYVRFQDRGTSRIASARVWEIGAAGNRLYVDVAPDTGRFRAVCETALGSVSSQVGSDLMLAYAPGGPVGLTATRASSATFASQEDTVRWLVEELLVVQDATGALRIVESVGGAAVASGDMTAALAFPAGGAYGAATLRINADGAGGNVGCMAALERRSIPWQAAFTIMSDQQLMDFARAS